MSKKAILKARAVLGLMLLCAAAAFSLLSPAERAVYLFDPEPGGFSQAPPRSDSAPSGIVGLNDVVFTPPAQQPAQTAHSRPRLLPLTPEYLLQLSNFNYLISQIFLVDPSTILLPSDINVPEFLEKDLTVDTSADGPQVLIFHTHSNEQFVDSNPADPMSGIMGVGRRLAQVLAERHGIETMHYTGRFDIIDGRSEIPGAYERMEPIIRQILADNPSIQMVIDLHRDGVPEHVPPFITYVNGRRTAQIMFFNGLSRRYRNGQITAHPWLYNPYQRENLAFSFNLQLAANQLYPGLARRIYLREFRYSLHMLPLSTLIEVGAQNNTRQEALNAMEPLADIIAAVILGGE